MPYELTAEQIAIREERKRKKLVAQANAPPDQSDAGWLADESRGKILKRDWVQLRPPRSITSSVKVMSWNMLAQILIRRDLFPYSDCLRGSAREWMLPREILTYGADIVCLQEVDRLDKLIPALKDGGYLHTYAAGHGKRHGCMILYREPKLRKVSERVVHLDEQYIREGDGTDSPEDIRRRRGSTRKTKNIALLVALAKATNEGTVVSSEARGYIVATCHLFWHPRHVYERARQGAIILHEISRFQAENGYSHWPVFFAGDFNSQPTEALYSLLVGDPLTPTQISELEASHAIHFSIDPSIKGSIPLSNSKDEDEDDEEEEEGAAHGTTPSTSTEPEGVQTQTGHKGQPKTNEDPDRTLTNHRPAVPSDGLLSTSELVELFRRYNLRSAYGSGHSKVFVPNGEGGENTFGTREESDGMGAVRRGRDEPKWTCFTQYWRLTLDYIFVLDSSSPQAQVDFVSQECVRGEIIGLLKTHRAQDLEPGLPKLDVCASDHIALCAEIDY